MARRRLASRSSPEQDERPSLPSGLAVVGSGQPQKSQSGMSRMRIDSARWECEGARMIGETLVHYTIYEVDPLLCPFFGAEIGTRRRRRRGGAAAPSAVRLWADPRLHPRLRHRPRHPQESQAPCPGAHTARPRPTSRVRASGSDSLTLDPKVSLRSDP